MNDREGQTPPILSEKHHEVPATFTPERLLHEARSEKGVETVITPLTCLRDYDGEIVRQFCAGGRPRRHKG